MMLLEKLDENPFQIVMDLLPKVETIEWIDRTQPEIAAMKVAYETALSVLNRMSGSSDVLKYMLMNDKLQEKYEERERLFGEAKALCDKLEFHKKGLKNLYQVHGDRKIKTEVVGHYSVRTMKSLKRSFTLNFKITFRE